MRARRAILVASLIALVAVPAALPQRTATRTAAMQALDDGVLAQLNAIRRAHGLVPLRENPELAAAALAHSSEMVADGYFSHDSYDGAPFWKRLAQYAHGDSWSVGENLLWSSPVVGASTALALWMASPEHRQNILTASWREIGIAAVHVDSAPGVYHGHAVTVITTDFGVRR